MTLVETTSTDFDVLDLGTFALTKLTSLALPAIGLAVVIHIGVFIYIKLAYLFGWDTPSFIGSAPYGYGIHGGIRQYLPFFNYQTGAYGGAYGGAFGGVPYGQPGYGYGDHVTAEHDQHGYSGSSGGAGQGYSSSSGSYSNFPTPGASYGQPAYKRQGTVAATKNLNKQKPV